MPLNQAQIQESFSSFDKDLKDLLPNILQLNVQQDLSEKIVINSLNKQLSSPKSRSEALEILNVLIFSCSNNVIVENALNWLNYCLVQPNRDTLKEIKLVTLGNIIEHSYSNQEFTKKFVSDYIAKVLDSCISIHENSQEAEAALKTLTICLRRYASWFNIHRVKIENFLLTFLDNSSDILVELAAVAFLYFHQVGGAGIDGINHKQNFSLAFNKFCVTCHRLLDVFLENEVEIEQYDLESEESYALSNVSCDTEKNLHVTAMRIKNCIKFLKIMLLKAFPVVKEIKPMDIIRLINRGTNLHICLSRNNEKTLKEFQFSLLLINIQTKLLELLRVLLIWLQTNSWPFAYNISKILIDSLNRSKNCKCFESNRQYQNMVYKGLITWIKCIKCSLHVKFQTQLINCILKTITPLKIDMTLSVQQDIYKRSNKFKKKAIQNRIIASGQHTDSSLMLSSTEKEAQIKNCSLALDTLRQLLNHTALKIDPKKIQELYSVVIENLIKINSFEYSHPYTDAGCQEKLYSVLIAFYDQENNSVLPPISLSLNILNKGLISKYRNVKVTCEKGLGILEKLCQPICPSMYVPEMFNLTNNLTGAEKQMTEQNLFNEIMKGDNEKEDESTNPAEDIINISFDELEDHTNNLGSNNATGEVALDENGYKLPKLTEEHISISDEFENISSVSNDVSISENNAVGKQRDRIKEATQVTSTPIKESDTIVVESSDSMKDDEDSLSGAETVLFEEYVKEPAEASFNQSKKNDFSQPNELGEEQLTNGTAQSKDLPDIGQECLRQRRSSSNSEDDNERPFKLCRLDLPEKEKSYEEINISDEFVDEVKEY